MGDWRKLFRELSRTIESCEADSLFSTSFNEYMRLTVKLITVPINFVQSMKLNINVVGKKRKVEQDRRTCIWPDVEVLDSSPTIHRFALDYPIGIVGGHPIHLHQLQEVLHLPTHPLLLLTSSILTKSDARIPISSIARLDYTISTHCIASWISS